MKVTKVEYSIYRQRLTLPFSTSMGTITEKRGFLFTLSTNEISARGDTAPFPEYGSESFETAEKIIRELPTSFPYYPTVFSDVNDIEKLLAEMNSFPAIKHGVEQALVSLMAKVKDTSISDLFNIKTRDSVDINAIIGMLSPEEVFTKAGQQVYAGYKTIKLKVGRSSFEEDLEAIKAVSRAAGKNVKLRIDVNGKWEFDEAVENLGRLMDFNIEYAEQPVSSMEDFIELSRVSPLPIAADELIRSIEDAKFFIDQEIPAALVLKPMMLGGIKNTLDIIKQAEKNNHKVVISSSFESSVGRRASLFLASAVKQDVAHGLGVGEYFYEQDPFEIIDGTVEVKDSLVIS